MVPSAPSVQCSSKSEDTFLPSHTLYLFRTYCLFFFFAFIAESMCGKLDNSPFLMEIDVVVELIWPKCGPGCY